jgi:hypothetical protein
MPAVPGGAHGAPYNFLIRSVTFQGATVPGFCGIVPASSSSIAP